MRRCKQDHEFDPLISQSGSREAIIGAVSYIPSQALSVVLANASVGIWLERMADDRTSLVCKLPETAIKAIYRGARTTFLVGSVRAETLTILCLGLWVDDERERPFKALMINSSQHDKALLSRVLEAHAVTLHCVNELNHPVLSASCTFDPDAADVAAAAVKASDHWILTPAFSNTVALNDLSRILDLALDRFQAQIHDEVAVSGTGDIGFAARVPMALEIWMSTETFVVTPTCAAGPFLIGDQSEGSKLEEMILALLDSVYPGRAYLSPVVQDGKVSRELADALAFDERFICIIQAKALAVLSADDQTSSRRIANVEKDIRKGLKQLAGALGNIRSCAPISTRKDGTSITPSNRNTSPAHAILILSEMYYGVDWKAVAGLLTELSQSEVHRALFHVLDIQEFSTLSTNCQDSTVFSNRLLQRWVSVQEKGTCYLRTRLPV